MKYDLDNRVITVDVNNSDVEYRYDALGRRVIRKEGSDKYLLTTRPKLLLNDTETALFISGYGDRLSSGHLGNWMRKMLTKAEITTQFIIDTVAPVFNKFGYAGTSMSDITKATGLTKGAVERKALHDAMDGLVVINHECKLWRPKHLLKTEGKE